MDDGIVCQPSALGNDEDYTDAVCLLILPKKSTTHLRLEVLIDSDQYPRLSVPRWLIMGGRVMYYESWYTPGCGRGGTVNNIARWIMNPRHNQWVDHVNRNPLDNRRRNLRFCTRSQNAQNRPGKPGRSSKYKGVSRKTGTNLWVASATLRGRTYRLGTFETEDQAALAYNRFVKKRCPEFGFLNPIRATPGDLPFPGKARRRRRRLKPLSETPEGKIRG